MLFNDKYLDRITSQHKAQPKYMAWLASLLDKIQDLTDLANMIDPAFDLETAEGVQLDVIGELIGVNRLLSFEPTFAPSALLEDEDYRLILRARISLNQWDGTTAGICTIWADIFPEAAIEVVDNQDMTMTIRVYGLSAMFASEYISNGYAAPKPQGVGTNYEFILSTNIKGMTYIGAKVTSTRTRFDLSSKWLRDDLAMEGEMNAAAFVANTRVRFRLGSHASPGV
jgi:hypothetical protein